MVTKVVHFTIRGRKETAEFSSTDNPDDVRDLFRSAAEAGQHDVLKLYNRKGNIINISPTLASNTPDDSYRLEVVTTSYDTIRKELGLNLTEIEGRLQTLEVRLLPDRTGMPEMLQQIKQQLDSLKGKLESMEHLSWLGLTKDLNHAPLIGHVWNKSKPIHRGEVDNEHVFDKFKKMCYAEVSSEVRNHLKEIAFNNWEWDDTEMLLLLKQMYIDLGFVAKFNIPVQALHNWLFELYRNYNTVPFHNFKHCFMVSQMMYCLISLLDLRRHLEDEDLIALLTACICHDLDHPGYNNAYQINAGTDLALRYNDISPLENHHAFVAFRIFRKPECNIFVNLSSSTFKRVRTQMIRCILATDMAKHSDILTKFKSLIPQFDLSIPDHKDTLMMILIKCADISNECRPIEVAEPWIDCLLQEFFNQSDSEKMEGLPVATFMDRDKVDKSSSQVGFIKFVLLPLFHALGELYPTVEETIVPPLLTALQYYSRLMQQDEFAVHQNGDS